MLQILLDGSHAFNAKDGMMVQPLAESLRPDRHGSFLS